MPFPFGFEVLFTTVVVDSAGTAGKLAVGVIEPATLAFYRCFFAFLILTPFCAKKIPEQIHNIRDMRILVNLNTHSGSFEHPEPLTHRPV